MPPINRKQNCAVLKKLYCICVHGWLAPHGGQHKVLQDKISPGVQLDACNQGKYPTLYEHQLVIHRDLKLSSCYKFTPQNPGGLAENCKIRQFNQEWRGSCALVPSQVKTG